MDVVGLISGGKDSVFNLLLACRLGHRIVCLANLHPGPNIEEDGAAAPEELDSFMFQTVGHSAITAVAACMGLPLVRRTTSGKSQHRGMHYPSTSATNDSNVIKGESTDEVEDLYQLLVDVKSRFPSVRCVAVGAILSSYQRHRVEAVCARLGLVPVAFLWQRRQPGLLRDMVAAGIDAVLVKVASFGLSARMLGRSISELEPTLRAAQHRFGLNVCGEGGEYETMTLHCPGLYAYGRVAIDDASIVHVSSDVAHWQIKRCHVEALPKAPADSAVNSLSDGPSTPLVLPAPLANAGCRAGPLNLTSEEVALAREEVDAACSNAGSAAATGIVRAHGSFVHVSGLTVQNAVVRALAPDLTSSYDPSASPSAQAESHLHIVMTSLQRLLASQGCTLSDVAFVHLYLADMALFGPVNAAYCQFFGNHPPSRSCVALDSVGRRDGCDSSSEVGDCEPLLLIDCIALRGSGAAIRATDSGVGGEKAPAADLALCRIPRSTLHVQSLSCWAPLCIGPYCQANVVGDCVWAAGSIGLVPQTMRLVSPTPVAGDAGQSGPSALAAVLTQTQQALLNVARVLGSLDSGLPLASAVTVYVSQPAMEAVAATLCREQRSDVSSNSTASTASDVSALVTSMVCAWVCGLMGRAPFLQSTSIGDIGDHDGDSSSDGTFSPPGSQEGDGADDDVEATDVSTDPCGEREFSLGPHGHSRPPYLPADARAEIAAAPPLLSGYHPATELFDPRFLLPSIPVAIASLLPVRTVAVPCLPRNAAVEVEVVAAVKKHGSSEEGEHGPAVSATHESLTLPSGHAISSGCWRSTAGSGSCSTANVFVSVSTSSTSTYGDMSAKQLSPAAIHAATSSLRSCLSSSYGSRPYAVLHVRAYVAGISAGKLVVAETERQLRKALTSAFCASSAPALTVLPAEVPCGNVMMTSGPNGDLDAEVPVLLLQATATAQLT